MILQWLSDAKGLVEVTSLGWNERILSDGRGARQFLKFIGDSIRRRGWGNQWVWLSQTETLMGLRGELPTGKMEKSVEMENINRIYHCNHG